MADGLTTFLGALESFGKNMQGYAVQRTLQQANQQVQAIRDAETNEAEQQKQIKNVADNLSMYLMGQGAQPSQIEQAREIFGQSNQMSQLEKSLILQSRQQAFSKEQQARGFTQQEQMFEEREAKKLSKERRSRLETYKKQYVSGIKGFKRAMGSVRAMERLIDSDSPMAVAAAGVLMARGSGEVGNLSEAEQMIWKGRADLWSKLKRAVAIGTMSKMTEADKEALKGVINEYKAMSNEQNKDLAQTLAAQAKGSELFVDSDPNELISQISGGKYNEYVPFERQVEQAQNMQYIVPTGQEGQTPMRPPQQRRGRLKGYMR